MGKLPERSIAKIIIQRARCIGLFFSGPYACAHTRLSVIDTASAANQPFCDESGRYVLVFNGEIFNFAELRDELLSPLSVRFRTRSDTEVLLYLLIRFGPSVLPRLRGFWAFAFYDTEKNELLLSRDRFGQKPLWYTRQQDFLAFASEFKALNTFPLRKEPDPVSYELFFRLSYLPAPWTPFRDVHKLEPGHYLQISGEGSIRKECWYRLRIPERPAQMPYSEALEAVRRSVTESVSYRLIADVPAGAFLSGGTDSAVVSAVAASLHKGFSTYSLSFSGMPYMDESAYAAQTAAFIGTDHHSIPVGEMQMETALEEVLEYTDDLFADSSAIAVHMLCREVGRYITVALSGDGGDEIFGGYRKHRALCLARRTEWFRPGFMLLSALLPSGMGGRTSLHADRLRKILKFVHMSALEPETRYAYTMEWFHRDTTARLLQDKGDGILTDKRIHAYLPDSGSYLSRILLGDLRGVLQGDMLPKIDLFSMRNGLEVRNPLLDHHLAELLFSLPDHYKIGGGTQKRILKDAFRDMLPPDQFNRPKKGFEVPLQVWLRGTFNRRMKEEWLNRETIEKQGVLNYSYIQEKIKGLESGREADAHFALWNAIVFTKWFTLYA